MTTPDPSREAFEKWAISEYISVKRSLDGTDGYFEGDSQIAWNAWQAAMAHKGAYCWQSIETAPKDGTDFLALIGDQPYQARFDERGRFVRFIHTNFDCKPTHWAPLPTAPKQEGST